MKIDHLLFQIAVAMLFLCSLSLGGLDQSGNIGAVNMTASEFRTEVPSSNLQESLVDTGAPEATSTYGGTENAVFTQEAPPAADLKRLTPSSLLASPPGYMYYNGDYLAWSDFSAIFPGDKPGLWIERAVSWTFYATLPWGSWTRELIYVPQASPVTMYESYPGGYILGYNMGLVQPGYYYIWYYADTLGRHSSIISTNAGYSNAVVVDVYPGAHYIKPNPPEPGPKEKCEQNPACDWVNGQCYCRGLEDPEKEKCEQSENCAWVDGRCNCFMPEPEPEPMPGPVPNPNPEPEPFNPAPNPVAECQSNPGCQWTDGRCNCMGLGGGSDYSNYQETGGDTGTDI